MNKKLMAVAVAGVLTAPAAFAQSSNVELYGRANIGIDNYRATGGTNPNLDRESRVRIFDNASRVGLRGTEDLGGGLKAIFQFESGVNVDNGSNTGQSGSVNSSSGFWTSRDSYAGLAGNWGQVTFGKQSIYWANGLNGQFQANYINLEIPWENGTVMSRLGSTVARQPNVVAYTSPTFAGINGTFSYSPNDQEGVQNQGGATAVDADGRIWAATLRGTWGGIYAQYDYMNRDFNTIKASGFQRQNTAHKLGLSWGYMPGARFGGTYVRAYDDGNATIGDTLNPAIHPNARQDGWTLFWEHTFGQFQALASYGQTGDVKDCGLNPARACGDSSAKGYVIGGRYFMSKRTWLYLTYNQVSNKSNGFSDYAGASMTSVTPADVPAVAGTANTPYGADPRVFALGLFHAF